MYKHLRGTIWAIMGILLLIVACVYAVVQIYQIKNVTPTVTLALGTDMTSFAVVVALNVVATLINLTTVAVSVALAKDWKRRWVLGLLALVLVVNALALGAQIGKAQREHANEDAILAHKERLVKLLGEEINRASGIEYRMESLMTRGAMTQAALDGFIAEIEFWRTRLGDRLEEALPRTYAGRVFLASRGDFPGAYVVVGRGVPVKVAQTPGFYQYTHVRECRRVLTAILASLDSFVRLSADVKA